METSMKLNDEENFKNEIIKSKISDGRECQRVQKNLTAKTGLQKLQQLTKMSKRCILNVTAWELHIGKN